MWKDFFYFSRTERQGIIILVVLIIGVCIAPKIRSMYNAQQEITPNDSLAFEKEYQEFAASLQEMKPSKQNKQNGYHSVYPERQITLFPFDPNTADSTTLLNLGLPQWMIKNIFRYRGKKGQFRRPEDFKKIYGLKEEQYQALLPYIRIATKDTSFKDTISLLAAYKDKQDSVFKYQPGTVVDLNKVDTTELKKIPGIGSGIARMIVNYRKQLGGFYQIEQLKDIHLKVEKIRPWFAIGNNQTQRINLNKASLERMMSHPYINYYQARVIVEYRKKKGKLNSLKQLSLYDEFDANDFERISPYVCLE